MKNSFFLSSVLVVLAFNSISSQCALDYGNLKLVWADSFTSQVHYDTSWVKRQNCNPYHDNVYYDSTLNILNTSSGTLTIRNVHDTTDYGCPAAPVCRAGGMSSVKWWPGNNLTNTDAYGVYEIRAKLPVDQGVWPSFWLGGQAGEIDVFESYNPSWTTPHFTNTAHDWSVSPSISCSHEWFLTDQDLSEYHTYAVAWRQNPLGQDYTITWFYDNKELWSQNSLNPPPAISMHLILDNRAKPDADYDSTEFVIDYVKVWEQIDTSVAIKDEPFPAMSAFAVDSREYSVAINSNNSVIYRGTDDWIHIKYFDAASESWLHGYLSTTFSPQEKCDGDVIVGENNHVFYRGTDGKIHRYHWTSNGWVHTNISDQVSSGTPPLVGRREGSLTVNSDNDLFYASALGWLYRITTSGSSYNLSTVLYSTNTNKACGGDLIETNGNLFYRGLQKNDLQRVYPSDGWYHEFITTGLGKPVKVNSEPGSLAPSKGSEALYLRDPNNFIQTYYKSTSQWYLASLVQVWNTQWLAGGKLIFMLNDRTVCYVAATGQLNYFKYITAGGANYWSHGVVSNTGSININNNLAHNNGNYVFIQDNSNKQYSMQMWPCENLKECGDSQILLNLTEQTGNQVSWQAFPAQLTPTSNNEGLNELMLNPNPVQNNLVVSGVPPLATELAVFAISGQLLYTQTVNSNRATINVSNLENGAYILHARGQNVRVAKKFTVLR